MAKTLIPKVNYLLVGLGIGSVAGLLFAPKSGVKTREYLAKRATKGNEYINRKARKLKTQAEELADRGKKMMSGTKEQIAAAIDAGRNTYRHEKSRLRFG
jgi:gas vesicle protein